MIKVVYNPQNNGYYLQETNEQHEILKTSLLFYEKRKNTKRQEKIKEQCKKIYNILTCPDLEQNKDIYKIIFRLLQYYNI